MQQKSLLTFLLNITRTVGKIFSDKIIHTIQHLHENTCVRVSFYPSGRPAVWNFIKKRFQHGCFSVNIAKFLETLILKKICERLLLNNVKRNYLSMKTVKQVLNVSQNSQENTFTRVSFLINIVAEHAP